MSGEVWGRQPCDTDASFLAWVEYRDQMPPRHIRSYNPLSSTWYRENSWPERAALYDIHMDEIRLAEREAMYRQSEKERTAAHLFMLKDMRDLAALEVQKFLASAKASEMPLITKPSELAKLMDTVIKYERLIAGQATERTESATDLSALSTDEAWKLRELLVKAQKKE